MAQIEPIGRAGETRDLVTPSSVGKVLMWVDPRTHHTLLFGCLVSNAASQVNEGPVDGISGWITHLS